MRIIAICIFIASLCTSAYATTPFPPKVFANDGWAFVAAFAWPDEDGKVLIIRTVRKISLLSLEELGIDKYPGWTSAGSQWYWNSIGYVTWLQIRGMDDAKHHHVFYFRNIDGKERIIDLNTFTQIDPALVLNRSDLNERTITEASNLIQSENPHDRQTAAIHLGHLGNRGHLSVLRDLLNDETSFTQTSGNETRTVYFVKEAAKKATALITQRDTANNHLNPISGSSIKLPEKD